MSITLELTVDEERLLGEAAAQRGIDVPAYLKTSALQAAAREQQATQLWEGTQRLAKDAVQDAQEKLRRQGISLIYQRDGAMFEESPEGVRSPVPHSDGHT